MCCRDTTGFCGLEVSPFVLWNPLASITDSPRYDSRLGHTLSLEYPSQDGVLDLREAPGSNRECFIPY